MSAIPTMPSNRSQRKLPTLPGSPSRPLPRPTGRSAALAALRRQVERLERGGSASGRAAAAAGAAGTAALTLGVAELDAALPGGGLRRAALHEVLAAEADGTAAAFVALLAARRAAPDGGTVLWCTARRGLYGPGLAAFGLDPARLLLAWGRRDEDRLWAMEEGLRCPRLAAVVGEARRLDLKQSRRLQLAAAASGVTALLLRPPGADLGAGAAVTRWRVASAPSGPTPGYAGVGAPCFRLELLRARGGPPGAWCVQWDGRALTPAGAWAGHGSGDEDEADGRQGPGSRQPGPAAPAAGAVVALVAGGAA